MKVEVAVLELPIPNSPYGLCGLSSSSMSPLRPQRPGKP